MAEQLVPDAGVQVGEDGPHRVPLLPLVLLNYKKDEGFDNSGSPLATFLVSKRTVKVARLLGSRPTLPTICSSFHLAVGTPEGLVLWCVGALVHWCSGALVLWCSGALVNWRLLPSEIAMSRVGMFTPMQHTSVQNSTVLGLQANITFLIITINLSHLDLSSLTTLSLWDLEELPQTFRMLAWRPSSSHLLVIQAPGTFSEGIFLHTKEKSKSHPTSSGVTFGLN